MSNNYEFYANGYNKKTIDSLNDYIAFCQQETIRRLDDKTKLYYNVRGKTGNHLKIDSDVFYFDCKNEDMIKYFNNNSLKEFPLLYLKYEGLNKLNKGESFKGDVDTINKVSDIYEDINKFKLVIDEHLSGTFVIWGKFTLDSPFYSADDENYYIIDNPVMKEKVFKVPMFRASSWKGVLASAVMKVMDEGKENLFIENYLSFIRLFGTGSDEFRALEKFIKPKLLKEEFKNKLKIYALLELGIKIKFNEINIEDKLWAKVKRQVQTQRGRLIFYPSYFDKIALEMINPHKRRTKAGTNPVYYEVVPKGAGSIFQLLYVPADGLQNDNDTRKKEIQNDFKLLTKALKKIFQEQDKEARINIGAKTKLGWGRIKHKKFLCLIKQDNAELPSNDFFKEVKECAE